MKSKISLDQLLQSYLETHVLRSASIRNFRQVTTLLQHDLQFVWQHEADEKRILAWRNAVIAQSSAITWNNYHTHLRALFNFALKKHWIESNVFLKVTQVRIPKLKKKTIKLASLEHMLEIIQQHKEQFDPPAFWTTVIKVFFFTGIRQQQLLMLK